MENYGLIHKNDPRDWILGAETDDSGFINIDDWYKYFPTKEKQHSTYFDTKGCATFAILNQSETAFNYLVKDKIFSQDNINWLNDNGYIDENGNVNFSDRFCLIQNGTTRKGNYFTQVYNSAFDEETGTGLIPESMLPYPVTQRTPVFDWDDFYNPDVITDEMKKLGKEFLRRFTINYYRVNQSKENRDKYLKGCPLVCGVSTGCAHLSTCSINSNHAILYYTEKLIDAPDYLQKYFEKGLPLFDSYESRDKDFLRQVNPDYKFPDNMRAIKIKENIMTNFIKEKDKSAVYFLGADKKLHPIVNEIAFKELFGSFDKVVEVEKLEQEIGDMVGLIKR